MNTSSSTARLRPFRPVPFGRYTLLSQLATGGMGEIFLARLDGMQGFEKLCVIKKILPQLAADPEFVERFVGEARTLVKLSHGSIAQVLDMGVHESEAFMALEFVDGKDLRKVAARARDRQKPLPPGFVLFVMGRVLDALAYAHRKRGDDEGELNLVHRDISPQNILISYEGEVKVIDFGLAKSRLSAAKTNPSIILGKFLYMSPEQARHQPVDRRSDLYAVGLCLYELLSGRNPFEQLPPGELMSAVAHPEIAPLGQVAPAVPPALAQLVMKALAVQSSQRFQTAEELRTRLHACMAEMDPAAGPESISRSMHELFGTEYMTERRMLVSLREVGRAPEPEPVVIGMPEGVPARPMPTLPPKTIRLDGPVEALSFKPTPRTRDGGPAREEGETRPAVVVDEPTRPAVALEAIEESRRERPSSPGGVPSVPEPPDDYPLPGAIAPTRELQVPPEPPPAPPPAPLLEWVALEAAGGEPVEDTPAWSEPLPEEEPQRAPPPRTQREEVPAWSAPPGRSASAVPVLHPTSEDELPVLNAADLGPEALEVSLEDTQPRIHRPSPRLSRQDLPRMPSPDVYHQDTQPRVVLDESLLRDAPAPREAPAPRDPTQHEEVSQGGRPKPVTGARSAVPRRRVTATGLSVVVPPGPARVSSSNPRATAVARERRDESQTSTTPSAPPVVPASARPAASSGRAGWIVGISLLVVLVGLFGTVVFLMLHPERVPVPLRARLLPLLGHEPNREEAPDPSALRPLARQPEKPPAPVVTAPTPAAPTPPAPTPVPPEPEVDDSLLSLSSPDNTPSKRPQPGRTRRVARNPTLDREWRRAKQSFQQLTRTVSCENLKTLCIRFETLEADLEAGGDEASLLTRVRAVAREIQQAQRNVN